MTGSRDTLIAHHTRAALWLLLAVAALIGAMVFLLLSTDGGLFARPAALDGALARLPVARPDMAVAAVLACLAVVLVAVAAVSRARLGDHNRLLIEALAADPNGRVLVDGGGRLVYGNPAFERMLGPDAAERFARLGEHAADEEGRSQIVLLNEIAEGGGQGHAEVRICAADGAEQWVNMSARPLHSKRGGVLWCIEDVTSRREMELVLAEERAKLIDFLENAPVGFYSVDGSGVFEYANRTLADWLGLPAESLVREGWRLHDVIAGTGADPARPYDPFPPGFRSARGEVMLRRADGGAFPAEIIQAVAGDAEAGDLHTRSIVRDLTAEREFEEILQASEQRFRKLFEDAPTGIALLGPDGEVIDCNRAFERIMGIEGEAPGRRVADLVVEDDREAVSARIRQVMEGSATPAPLDVRVGAGAESSAALSLNRFEGPAEAPGGLILHVFDTTQHRRLEAQFTQSQKMQAVGQLAGGVAHDFNNLLTVMIGFCDLILQRYRPGEQTFADIMQIKQNANRAANLVRQLLAFSRQQTLQPKVLNITDVLAELTNLLRRLIGVNITLDVKHGRDLGLVKVDQVQFEQVIINLAVNARDAMKDSGGTLAVRTANATLEAPLRRGADTIPAGEYVRIDISDTGVGIPREHLERIFEPFFSTKEVGSGTGLGLSTVYGIVSQTGGFIQVDSRPGEGTTFTIYLPRYEEVAEGEAPGLADAPRLTKDLSGVGTVLLVEDEDPVRMFGARALRNKGYEVLEAKNGAQALDVLADAGGPVDLVISDVVMPQMDGPALIREVRSRCPGMKVIFISGYAEDDFRESIERDSQIHFLSKPFSLEQLAGKVKDVLAE